MEYFPIFFNFFDRLKINKRKFVVVDNTDQVHTFDIATKPTIEKYLFLLLN